MYTDHLAVAMSQESECGLVASSTQGVARLQSGVGWTTSLSGAQSPLPSSHVGSRIQFLVDIGLTFVLACWLSARSLCQRPEAPTILCHGHTHRPSHNTAAYSFKARRQFSLSSSLLKGSLN